MPPSDSFPVSSLGRPPFSHTHSPLFTSYWLLAITIPQYQFCFKAVEGLLSNTQGMFLQSRMIHLLWS